MATETWVKVANLKGPQGDKGDPGTFAEAQAETVDAGTPASVELYGPSSARGVKFYIPTGPQGLPGVNAVDNDTAVATYMQTDGSATKTALGAVLGALPARAREQAAFASNYRRGMTPFTLPAGFTWNPGIPIFYDGTKYLTPIDLSTMKNTGGNTIHVNTVTGSNGSGTGSAAAPYASIGQAVTVAADGDDIVVDNAGFVWLSYGPTATIAKSINIRAANPGQTTFIAAQPVTYSITSGYENVWQATRSQVRQVIDLGIDPDGFEYPAVADIATCSSSPGSWYTDGTTLYVHPISGVAPDPNVVIPLLAVNDFFRFATTGRTSPMKVYLEGFRVLGGQNGLTVESDIAQLLTFLQKDVEWLHGGYAPYGTTNPANLFNGLNVIGNVLSLSQDTRVAYSALDAFNYHADTTTTYLPYFMEIGCEAHDAGTGWLTQALAAPDNENGSTCHDGIRGIRIGSLYHHGFGMLLADVTAGTQTVNLSCAAWDSVAVTDSLKSAGGSPQAGSEVWFYGCKLFGTKYDVQAKAGSTVHVIDTQFDTQLGGGTLDIQNPL